MKFTNLAGVLALAASTLLGSVSAYEAQCPIVIEDSKSVNTINSCKTEYCGLKIDHVPTAVETVHKTIDWTTTSTPKASTCYVTSKHHSTTVVKTVTKTYTVTGDSPTFYVTSTVKVTSVSTISSVSTYTTSLPDVTESASVVIVPTPDGFINVGEDPANTEAPSNRKRYAAPRYPSAVKCTKTLETVYNHVVTSKQPKTTVTKYGETFYTTTTKLTTKTVYPPYADITTVTKEITTTIKETTTLLSGTTKTIASTSSLPATTSYAACNPANIYSGPSGNIGAMVGPFHVEVPDIDTPEACCIACQEHVSDGGANSCAGSFFVLEDGVPSCVLKVETQCAVDTPGLVVSLAEDDDGFQGYISNGPCGQWKVLLSEDTIPGLPGGSPTYSRVKRSKV
ncbi:hypothetical protein ABW19_dt0208527 [Dactylella cylindrospora]|nr:hypothetical protein ABW19_dt0208527 [Dactylella cylindrospora]